MGQNSKIRTLRKAMRLQLEQHERFKDFTPEQRERWLSMSVRDAMRVVDERVKPTSRGNQG
jgi:hypothetical protein